MKSHGVLMSGEMVCAWLAGLKWQTRRTRGLDKINEKPDAWEFMGFSDSTSYLRAGNSPRYAAFSKKGKAPDAEFIRLPYGYTGDALYFKETWKMWERDDDGRDFLHFRADDAKVDPTVMGRRWNPSSLACMMASSIGWSSRANRDAAMM